MIVLALDTSGGDCAVCLYDSESDRVLAEVCETIGKGHAERLMAILDSSLQQARLPLQKVGRIAVTIGPGSFTGIRVGVAAARGFALAIGVEAVGVSTLETIAAHWQLKNPGMAVAVVIDAKRGEVYFQRFDALRVPVDDACILQLADAMAATASFGGEVIGSGASLFRAQPQPGEPVRFLISTVARLGAAMPPRQPRPRPLYLRGPDARPQTGFALERLSVA